MQIKFDSTYSNNRSSRLRNIIEIDFNKREILSQIVGFDNSVLNKVEPTQSVGSRVDLDAFLYICDLASTHSTLHYYIKKNTYTMREQETENNNIDNGQMVADKVSLGVQMSIDFFLQQLLE